MSASDSSGSGPGEDRDTLIAQLQATLAVLGAGASAGGAGAEPEPEPEPPLPHVAVELLARPDPSAIEAQNAAACGPGHDDELLTLGSLNTADDDIGSVWMGGQVVWPSAHPPAEEGTPSLLISAERYREICDAHYGDFFKILRGVNRSYEKRGVRLIAAGGVAAAPFFEHADLPGQSVPDVDVFVIAGDETEEDTLWAAIQELMEGVCRISPEGIGKMAHYGGGDLRKILLHSVEAKDGLLTTRTYVGCGGWDHSHVKFSTQVILRRYPDLGSILHAFDLAASGVATDGRTTWLTIAAAATFATRALPIWPARRSLSFEWRLKKYAAKGLGLLFSTAAPIAPKETIKFGIREEAQLTVVTSEEGGLLVGSFGAAHKSDYEEPEVMATARWEEDLEKHHFYDSYHRGKQSRLARQNLEILHATPSGATPKFVAVWTGRQGGERHDRGRWRRLSDDGRATVPFPVKLTSRSSRRASQILSRRMVEAAVDSLNKPQAGSSDLVKILGVRTDQALGLVAAYNAVSTTAPDGTEVRWSDAIIPARRRLFEAYREKVGEGACDWWITNEPGRQWTASRDPRPADPAEWFEGQRTSLPGDGKVEECDEGRPVEDDAETVPTEETCAICRETVVPGALGTVATPCGHYFHFSARGEDCQGLARWIAKKNECPMCRAKLVPSDSEPVPESEEEPAGDTQQHHYSQNV